MPKFIDNFLNRTTMYRLLVYYLGGLLSVAFLLSLVRLLPYDPVELVLGTGFLVAVAWLSNAIFAKIWNVPTNAESALITGLILALIITPAAPNTSFFFLFWAATLAMVSKYVLGIKGKHVFNPAAFGVAATALFIGQSATWWVGNLPMLPFVLFGGMLIPRKIHRTDLVLSFLVVAIVASVAFTPLTLGSVASTVWTAIAASPLLYFAFVMLTEPLTTPPRRMGRIFYGALVGLLFAPWARVGSFYFSPETALLAGNIFSYLISPKYRALLRLKEIRQLAADTYEFVFAGKVPAFAPGQYAEWTIASDPSDDRGNRRYFTLASSPTEQGVRLGVKFYPKPSSYKVNLAQFKAGSSILAGSVAGDFTLPRNASRKVAFIAGGIGVTPFRSMVKYMLDSKERRDAVLLYSNRSEKEIAYRDLFDAAERAGIGFRAVYALTDSAPAEWRGERGYIDAAMIAREVPDYRERTFYISGPKGMVDAFKKTLRHMGVPRWRIRTDFFPGFA